jgi:hypothetical protein
VGSAEYDQHSSKQRPVIRYDYFETPVTINGQNYIARFDVEVLPGANNYRTHQVINIDLTAPEASLVGPLPTASSGGPCLSTGSIFQNTENVKGTAQAVETTSGDVENSVGAAQAGFTTPGTELGQDRLSRVAETTQAYNQQKVSTAGVDSRESWNNIFRYQLRSEEQSQQYATEQLYFNVDGRETFLRDVDPKGYEALTTELREAPAWNDIMTDMSQIILEDLQGRAAPTNVEAPRALAIAAQSAGQRDAALAQGGGEGYNSPSNTTGEMEAKGNGQARAEVPLRKSGQRADGTDTGGPVSGVESGTGQDQSGYVPGRPADRGAAALTYG